jgi:hypothetical protein
MTEKSYLFQNRLKRRRADKSFQKGAETIKNSPAQRSHTLIEEVDKATEGNNSPDRIKREKHESIHGRSLEELMTENESEIDQARQNIDSTSDEKEEVELQKKRKRKLPQIQKCNILTSLKLFFNRGFFEPTREKLSKKEKEIRKQFDSIAELLHIPMDMKKYVALDYTEPIRDPHFHEKLFNDSVLSGYREFLSPKNYIDNEQYRNVINELINYVQEVTNYTKEESENNDSKKTFTYNADIKGDRYEYRIETQRIGRRIVDVKVFRLEANQDTYIFGSHIPMQKSPSFRDEMKGIYQEEFDLGYFSVSNMRRNFVPEKDGQPVDNSWGTDESDALQEIQKELEKIRNQD